MDHGARNLAINMYNFGRGVRVGGMDGALLNSAFSKLCKAEAKSSAHVRTVGPHDGGLIERRPRGLIGNIYIYIYIYREYYPRPPRPLIPQFPYKTKF